jgi:hypothetical protein
MYIAITMPIPIKIGMAKAASTSEAITVADTTIVYSNVLT